MNQKTCKLACDHCKPFLSSNLVFVKDSLLDMEFLIDSGSSVSIIPLSYVDNEEPATFHNLFCLKPD